MNEVILTEQQERYILSGYAAFAEEDRIYDEFVKAFPEVIDLISEEFGEQKYQGILKDVIRRFYPGHPKFDKAKYGVLFDSLRRHFLNSQEESYMGHSRNRLEVANDMRLRLLRHADRNPEDLVDCMRVLNQVTKEARSESIEFYKMHKSSHTAVAPDELVGLLAKLPEGRRLELLEDFRSGMHPELIMQQIQKEMEDIENGNTNNDTEQDQKVLPGAEDLQLVAEEDGTQTEHGSTSIDKSPDFRTEPQEGDEVEYLEVEEGRGDIPY